MAAAMGGGGGTRHSSVFPSQQALKKWGGETISYKIIIEMKSV